MIRIITILTAVLALLAFLPVPVYAQNTVTVSGTVYSGNSGQPLPGASIASRATGRTLLSDSAGRFVFAVLPASDTLDVSFVGYASRAVPAADAVPVGIAVYLRPSAEAIDEVVVATGYQTLPRERATGSFSHVSNSLFNRSVSPDLISRLEGVANGLAFGLPVTLDAPATKPDLRIRGLSTIYGERAPLIVLDNFPYEGDIGNINPNDVESITVLKDAAAASIWGARAGNGVIVVTTKRGTASGRAAISFNSNVSIGNRPDLYYSQKFLPPAEAVELERLLYSRGLYTKNDWTAYTPAIEILFAADEGTLTEAGADRMLEDLKAHDIREEASRLLYRQSISQQYALNVRGGGAVHQYYLSAGYDRQAANLAGNSQDRLTVNARNDIQPLPGLHIGTSISYMQGKTASNGITLRDLSALGMSDVYVYARLVGDSGEALPLVKHNRFAYTDNAPQEGLLDWHYRPLDELMLNDNTGTSHEIRLHTSVRYRIAGGLRAEARYQYQSGGNAVRTHYVPDSYYARSLINQFTQADGSRPVPLGGILDRSGSVAASHYRGLQAFSSNIWDGPHSLSGLAGFEVRQERGAGTGSSRLYGYDDGVLTHISNLDFSTNFPLRPRLSGRIPAFSSPGQQLIDRFVSYYANLAYDYRGRYVFSGSARWDASNIFGVSFTQKGVPLWSVGAAWNVSNEPFFNAGWVSYARLRVTYGANGNAVRSLSSLPYIRFGSSNAITGLPQGVVESVGNPELRWEQVNIANLGLDFTLFGNRVSGHVEWYDKNSSDLIGADVFDPTTGIIPVGYRYNLDNRRNYAGLRTSGADVELNTLNVDKVVKWQTTLLFSKVRNKVTNYRNPREPIGTDFLGDPTTIPLLIGNPVDQVFALPWHGLDGATGAPLVMAEGTLGTDYNTYFNNLAPGDVRKAGVSMPPYFGAVRNTFTWRSLSVSANILWKAGHVVRRSTVIYGSLLGSSRITHADYLKRWQQPGDELLTDIPSLPESIDVRRDQAFIWSEAILEKGDHIRLQDISLSWQLPGQYARRMGMSQVRLYGYAKNLGLLWKDTPYDIDPDVSALYPQPLQLSFGLQIQL